MSAGPTTLTRIGVIGGNGQMGAWLTEFWSGRGHDVLCSDRATPLTNVDVARQADVTFVAVPLHITPEVIASISGQMNADGAIVSIASLMTPSAQSLAGVAGEGLCMHPVFGPTVRGMAGLPVVIAAVRGARWCAWLTQLFEEAGFSVRQSTPAQHDSAMSVVQALLHSMYVALLRTFDDADMTPGEVLDWASPTMSLQLGLIARILGQDAALYADIVVDNPLAPARLESLARELQHLASFARSGDRGGFARAFVQARSAFGDQLPDLTRRAESALKHNN